MAGDIQALNDLVDAEPGSTLKIVGGFFSKILPKVLVNS